MADITQARSGKSSSNFSAEAAPETTAVRLDETLISYAELLFFAYRDFVSEPDEMLATFGFGRAHHRVIHFVYRHPGMRVAELLGILKIKKQSLSPVLKQLIDNGFIRQQAGKSDGRERRLYVTETGAKLAEELAASQVARIQSALQHAGDEAEEAARRFLFAMISAEEQPHVASLLDQAQSSNLNRLEIQAPRDKKREA